MAAVDKLVVLGGLMISRDGGTHAASGESTGGTFKTAKKRRLSESLTGSDHFSGLNLPLSITWMYVFRHPPTGESDSRYPAMGH